jgi:hypothetical protein
VISAYKSERDEEEGYDPGILASFTNTNLIVIGGLRKQIAKIDAQKSHPLELRQGFSKVRG